MANRGVIPPAVQRLRARRWRRESAQQLTWPPSAGVITLMPADLEVAGWSLWSRLKAWLAD